MRSFSELTRREKQIEVVRWLGVLPAALLGELTAAFLVRIVVRALMPGFGNDGSALYWLAVSLSHGLPTAAFVLAGSKVAPRRQIATALILTTLGFGRSLMTHIVVQNLGGNTVGLTNYVHFLADSAGLLCGVAYVVFEKARSQNRRSGSA